MKLYKFTSQSEIAAQLQQQGVPFTAQVKSVVRALQGKNYPITAIVAEITNAETFHSHLAALLCQSCGDLDSAS